MCLIIIIRTRAIKAISSIRLVSVSADDFVFVFPTVAITFVNVAKARKFFAAKHHRVMPLIAIIIPPVIAFDDNPCAGNRLIFPYYGVFPSLGCCV